MKNQKLYAFWRRVPYPYILSGAVVEITDDGSVKVEGFPGYKFRPLKILPEKAGKKLADMLDNMEAKHMAALREFDKTWKQNIIDIENLPIEIAECIGKIK